MTRIEPRSPGPLANTSAGPMSIVEYNNTLFKGIGWNLNIKESSMEFELAYADVTIQCISHSVTRTAPEADKESIIIKPTK